MGKTIKEFAEEMSLMMPKLFREFIKKQSHIIKRDDITVAQIAVLHLLKDKTRCKMSEVAKFISITTPAATGIVDRMVKSGFLKRAPDANDRRIVNIQLTPKGKKTISIIFKERQKMMIGIFKNFTAKERAAYLNTVKKIYSILTRPKRL